MDRIEAFKVVHKSIKKLEKRIEDCRSSPQSNKEYMQGLEHAVRFIKLELHDALHESKDDNNVKEVLKWR